RLRAGLVPLLEAGAPLSVRRACNPLLDAWCGAAEWVGSSAWKSASLSRDEYLEKGPAYLKVGSCYVCLLLLFAPNCFFSHFFFSLLVPSLLSHSRNLYLDVILMLTTVRLEQHRSITMATASRDVFFAF